jgi:hypothetical protein
MIGVMFALVLQAANAPSPSIGDLIGDILAQTPPDGPAGPVAVPPQTAAPPPAQTNPTQAPPPAFPDAAPDAPSSRYDSSVRSSFQAQEARQGDLDGRWTVTGADGKALYVLQLADPGAGRGPVEGAWRDPARTGAPGGSGFIDAADRAGHDLTLTFQDAGTCTLALTLGADGRWTGQLKRADQSQPVTMARP